MSYIKRMNSAARPQLTETLVSVDENSTIDWDAPAVDESTLPSQRIRVHVRLTADEPVSVPPES
jgi:hypothetical protein